MKKISKRSWMAMALAMALLAGLLIFVGSYFVNAKTWVTFPGSPHVYTGVNPDCGRIYDRSGMLLLNTDDGRVYNADETIRRSTMHLLGDRDGYISAPLLKTYASKMFGFDVVNGLYTSEPGSVAARLTISAAVQSAAQQALAGYRGTIGVYNYKTGELLCAGRLESGRFLLPGDVSSQFFSGLLFALPLLSGPSELHAATPPESAGYIAMTLAALRRFGIVTEPFPDGWAIPGGQRYRSPGAVRAEGDWSNAAFWLAAGALSRPVTVTGLQAESGQGDRVILEDLRRFGAEVEQNADAVTVRPAPLRGCSLDVRSTPDLAPPLALLAACAAGTTRITGAARLRYKESDRLASIAAALRALGADVRDLPDGLEIAGGRLTGGTVDACGDHRIAMLAAIASARCDVRLRGAECVEKSDPHFWQTLAGLRSGTEESR